MAVMSMGPHSGLTCRGMEWSGNGVQKRSVGLAAAAEGADVAEEVLLLFVEEGVGITISVAECRRLW